MYDSNRITRMKARSNNTVTIELPEKGISIRAQEGSNLWRALIEAGIIIDSGCGGRGRCNRCHVIVETEGSQVRVQACRHELDSSIKVNVPRHANLRSRWSKVLEPASDSLFAGVDLGTTTIGIYLADNSGEIVARCGFLNPQVVHGADVMTRLSTALSCEIKVLLGNGPRKAISERFFALHEEIGLDPERIESAVVVGNGAMALLAVEGDVSQLAQTPYINPLGGKDPIRLVPADWDLPEKTEVIMLPPTASFLGSDATVGAWAAGLDYRDFPWIYLDLGTNGEILLMTEDGVWGASTAAGPALEGGHLSCGMPAVDGAIYRLVSLPDGGLELLTIGDAEPCGLCGSGVLSAISHLRRTGIVDTGGRIQVGFDGVNDDDGAICWRLPTSVKSVAPVYITQKDIREVQFAKGALAAGLEILLERAGIPRDRITSAVVTGAFGTTIDSQDLRELGLIPSETPVRFIQDGAGRGAIKASIESHSLAELSRATRSISYVNLAEQPDFEDVFVSHLSFRKI